MSNNKDDSPYVIALNEMIRYYKDYTLNGKEVEYQNEFSPLSGSEPEYEPEKWNVDDIRYNHNCYAYVLNTIAPKRNGKPQPGYFSNFPPIKDKDYNCIAFYQRLKKDIPAMYLVSFDEKCKRGFYKGFLAIDPKAENSDYHFYREDKTRLWSHKPGRLEVRDYDASGIKIKNPAETDRKYEHFNYSTPCFFFCLNNKLSRSRSSLKHMRYF